MLYSGSGGSTVADPGFSNGGAQVERRRRRGDGVLGEGVPLSNREGSGKR